MKLRCSEEASVDAVTAICDWRIMPEKNITFAIGLLAFFNPLAPIGWLVRHRATGPKLVFGLEHGSSDDEVVANVGASVAADVRVRWTARSGMKMDHVPQPAMILPDESLHQSSPHPDINPGASWSLPAVLAGTPHHMPQN